MKKRNTLKAAIAAMAAGTLLAACGGSGDAPSTDGPIEIDFWHSASGASADVIRDLVNEFNDANDGEISVTEIFQGSYQDAISKLAASAGSVGLPDVMQVTDTSFGFIYDSGLAIPVEDLVEESNPGLIDDLVPVIGSYYTADEKLYAMPFQVSQPVIYANANLLADAGLDPDTAPESIEELTEWAQQIYDETGTPGMTLGLNSYWMEVLAASAGQAYCLPDNGLGADEVNAVNYTSAGQIGQWEAMQSIITSGALLNVGQQGADAQNAFGGEDAAMLMASSGNLGNVSKMLGEENLVVFPYPIDDPNGGVVPSGNALWVFDEDHSDAELDAAGKFVAFMGNAESQATIFEATGYLPNSASAIAEVTERTGEPGQVILAQLENTQGNTVTGGCHTGAMASLRSDAAQPAVEKIAAGEDVEQTLTSAEEAGAEIIERYLDRAGR